MKYQVIGAPDQVALIDFKADEQHARRACNTAEFSNLNPATNKPFEALVAAGLVWNTKRDANQFNWRCHVALAFESGKQGKWIRPTFVVVPINGHLVRKLSKERKARNAAAKLEAK